MDLTRTSIPDSLVQDILTVPSLNMESRGVMFCFSVSIINFTITNDITSKKATNHKKTEPYEMYR